MLQLTQTAIVLLSLIVNHPAYASELQTLEPVAEKITELNSTTTIAAYIKLKAREKGVDEDLALAIVRCESNFTPQQSKIIGPDGEREKSFGVWQINLPGKEITKEQAMDVEWSTDWALGQLANGKSSLWTCAKYVGK